MSLHEVIVEGSVGALGRADCHSGEVQLRDCLSGQGGGDGCLLPVGVGTLDQISCSSKPETDNKEPKTLPNFSLRRLSCKVKSTT